MCEFLRKDFEDTERFSLWEQGLCKAQISMNEEQIMYMGCRKEPDTLGNHLNLIDQGLRAVTNKSETR